MPWTLFVSSAMAMPGMMLVLTKANTSAMLTAARRFLQWFIFVISYISNLCLWHDLSVVFLLAGQPP
jgi:hypothetical protein